MNWRTMVCGMVAAGWLGATTTFGAIGIQAGSPVSQNFTIGTTQTAALPLDWKVDKNATARTVGAYSAAVSATEQSAGNSMSATAANGIYNYAAGVSNAATDRAIGWISSSSATKSGNLYVALTNSGAATITSLDIAYNVEKYRKGSNAAGFSIQLYHSTDGTTWTSAGAAFLTTIAADADNTGYAAAPGATVAVSGTLTGISVASGGTLYLAWNYSVASGSTTSNAQGLGVDDVSISVPSSATPPAFTSGTGPYNATSGVALAFTVTASGSPAPVLALQSQTASSGFSFTPARGF
jgi:hypothetical protein